MRYATHAVLIVLSLAVLLLCSPYAVAQSLPTTSADFVSRCQAGGVLRCVGFDSNADISGGYGANSGILPGDMVNPQIDTSVKASGNGSLLFTIPSNSDAGSSGSYFANFSSDLSQQFGENSDFYVQWRQRFSQQYVTTAYAGGDGWKQSIVGTGDKAGCSPSATGSGLCYAACTALEIVTQNQFHRNFAQMYDSCTGSTSHGAFDNFDQAFGSDWQLQPGRAYPYCLYSQGHTSPISYFPSVGNCFAYFPDEWMTFEIHVTTGPRVADEFTNSYVQLWIAREGQPAQLAINWGPYNLSAGSAAENQMFGKVWLLPYNTSKSSSTSYPTAYTWYDELIISTQPIAVYTGNSTTAQPAAGPSISNVSATGITSNSATISWTTAVPASSKVEYGLSTSYGSQTTPDTSLVTLHSAVLSGLAAGTTYNFRVDSSDASGNTVTSANFSFATADFAVTATAASNTTAPASNSATISPGNSESYTMTVNALNGFTGNVSFSVSGVPAAATASFNPASISTTGTTTLVITTSSTTPAGTYALTITARSGSLSHSAQVTLVVKAAVNVNLSADFAESATPSSLSVWHGSDTSSTIAVTPSGGFNSLVKFSVSGLPNSTGISFYPNSITGGGSTLFVLRTAKSTKAGVYTVTVVATGGGISHQTTIKLTVQ